MQNYKIKVNNEAESKEAQKLFFELGGVRPKDKDEGRIGIVVLANGFIYVDYLAFDESYTEEYDCKEITLPQLRDMVVLKRNSVEDATHYWEDEFKYRLINNSWHYFSAEIRGWIVSNNGDYDRHISMLKPIEKEMKEYLVKSGDKYECILKPKNEVPCHGWIEVPEGAEVYAYWPLDNEKNFHKGFKGIFIGEWVEDSSWTTSDIISGHAGAEVLWQRHEPVIDRVTAKFPRTEEKHSHYKKDVSNLEVIDIYRVTELFKPHSCGAHIAKKALCTGKRGHKDTLRDIQDIIDTAERWKQMIIEDDLGE